MGEVDEGLCSCVGEVLPLLGEADLAAELDADDDGTTVQVEPEGGEFRSGFQVVPLVHR